MDIGGVIMYSEYGKRKIGNGKTDSSSVVGG